MQQMLLPQSLNFAKLVHCRLPFTLVLETVSISIGRSQERWIPLRGRTTQAVLSDFAIERVWTLGRNARLTLRRYYVLQEPTIGKTE
jgi:hypothetical protein